MRKKIDSCSKYFAFYRFAAFTKTDAIRQLYEPFVPAESISMLLVYAIISESFQQFSGWIIRIDLFLDGDMAQISNHQWRQFCYHIDSFFFALGFGCG